MGVVAANSYFFPRDTCQTRLQIERDFSTNNCINQFLGKSGTAGTATVGISQIKPTHDKLISTSYSAVVILNSEKLVIILPPDTGSRLNCKSLSANIQFDK